MYGLINKAVFEMVTTQFGDDVWEQIRSRAGIEEDLFLSMRQYPDEDTYRLVGAASAVLKLRPEHVLEAFGRYWVIYTAREGYGELLKISGRTIWEFLANLDNLHARVGLTFAGLRPPSFYCTDVTPRSLRLHYRSTRQGLSSLVMGLLKGVGDMFGTDVDVQLLSSGVAQGGEDVFLVTQQGPLA